MANAGTKALHILVEDEVAKAVLREILRVVDLHFLRTVEIVISGDKDAIQRTMQALNESTLPVAAVRDGDTGSNAQQNMFSLPGPEPPEKEVCKCQSVKDLLQTQYGISMDDFMTTVNQNEHHSWFGRLAEATCTDESAITNECARVYVSSLAENERDSLVQQLKAAIER